MNPELIYRTGKEAFSSSLDQAIEVAKESNIQTILILRKRSIAFHMTLTTCLDRLGIPLKNLGALLAPLLLDGIDTADVFTVVETLLQDERNNFVCLDNAEILFDSSVDLDVPTFIQKLSKFSCLMVCIDAAIKDDCLVYGKPSQKEYKKMRNISDIVIIDAEGLAL
ncbi:MAG: BREX-3 system P-loop-containing protein BrxF [Sphaerochaetaceae bacterium]